MASNLSLLFTTKNGNKKIVTYKKTKEWANILMSNNIHQHFKLTQNRKNRTFKNYYQSTEISK